MCVGLTQFKSDNFGMAPQGFKLLVMEGNRNTYRCRKDRKFLLSDLQWTCPQNFKKNGGFWSEKALLGM